MKHTGIIDFTEITTGNKGGKGQDRFEQFAGDFLETMGLKVVSWPDRGADGGKDLIVIDKRPGITGETQFTWLVSCKHQAVSSRSVTNKDEINILERVRGHKCNGFMGIYSTIASSALSKNLNNLKERGDIEEFIVYDGTRIEKLILSSIHREGKDRLLATYFPKSREKYRNMQSGDTSLSEEKTVTNLTEEILLNISKTAIIILEIEGIKQEYGLNRDWQAREALLRKFYKYSNHTNEKIAYQLFAFLLDVSYETRHRFHSGIAFEIESLIMTFFPSSFKDNKEKALLIQNGKICTEIGFNIAYDSFIKTNNFSIAQYGLEILKYIYTQSKLNKLTDVVESTLEQFKRLEETLKRPERNDLGDAQILTELYKKDLDRGRIDYPDMPEYLYNRIEHDEKRD